MPAWLERASFGRFAIGVLVSMLAIATPAHAIRVATWNLIDYPNNNLAFRQPYVRTVAANLGADVIILQELKSTAGRDSFLFNVLNVVEPGQWAADSFFTGTPPVESGFFFKPSKLSVTGRSAISYAGVRNAAVWRVRPAGYGPDSDFRIYSVHFKAGNAAMDVTQRAAETTNFRTHLNTLNGQLFMVGGDYNIYSANEGAYVNLTESAADNDGRCKDPLNMPGNWNANFNYRCFHTQCPCLSADCLGGFAGGGMDDRFDFWLTSYPLQDGEGLDLVPGTYTTYGNDCNHFNDRIDGGGVNTAVGIVVATALHNASDHIPVLMTFQLPAQIAGTSALDFGTVITGAVAQLPVSISNVATATPVDELTYSFAAPADFSAPAGSFNLNAGAPAALHTISMLTGATGAKSGTLTVNSDAVDSTAKPVLLSGRVLRHASASLDSEMVDVSDSLEFGYHEPGDFDDLSLRVHNQSYDADQARLSLQNVVFTGGGGRFSIVGGFTPGLLAGVGRTFTVHFVDTGVTLDSLYEADLTFQSADEALPGATARPDLTVRLRAQVVANPSGAPPRDLPAALRFYAPRPNPLARETWLGFDLPKSAPVTLEIFDLSGRRVTSLAQGVREAGHHEVRWSGSDDSGARVAGGLYFARFQTPGMIRTQRIAVLP